MQLLFNKILEFLKKIISGIFKFKLKLMKRFFEVVKKPAVAVILISALVGLIFGSLGGIYIQPLLKDKLSKANNQSDSLEETLKVKTISEVVKEVSPAVVSVIISKYVPILVQEYYNPFGENSPFQIRIPRIVEKGKELKEIGGGSGFVISSDGLIVTNKHVVLDEQAQYTVLTNDGKKYPATVLARDPVQDVAIIKIDASNLSVARLGNSDNVEIGQTVVAIGNALGEFRNTVSAGIISGLMRTITAGGGEFNEQLDEVIQTDAAINPGNSGGPLLNLYGEVIGINTAMASGAENIAFAIPVNKIKKDINDIKSSGKIVYPFLGIRYILINQAFAEQNKLSVNYGALIQKGSNANEPAITPGSAAEKAGLKQGDIILELGNVKIDQNNTLSKLLLKYNPNQQIFLKVLRDNKEMTVNVVLGEWK